MWQKRVHLLFSTKHPDKDILETTEINKIGEKELH
jgi:hypothetical protein